MDDKSLQGLLERAGFAVDHGDLIAGPFIPDGTVRVYDPETSRILGRGDTLAEAYEEAATRGLLV
jgi:hypothetical protein